MRVLLRVLVAITSVLIVASPVPAGPVLAGAPVHDAPSDAAYVDRLLFSTSIGDFQRELKVALAADEQWFDWSEDGCSAPLIGNTGRSFNFTAACQRHDFGYRNLRRLELRYGEGSTYWNGSSRKHVDQQFLRDMKSHCHGRSILLRPTCYAWAQTFYTAVRLAGGP